MKYKNYLICFNINCFIKYYNLIFKHFTLPGAKLKEVITLLYLFKNIHTVETLFGIKGISMAENIANPSIM